MRIRGFTQDDSHIFCTEEQLQDEIASLLDFVMSVLRAFGFNDFTANLSHEGPEKYVGTDEIWDAATEALRLALEKYGLRVQDQGGRRRLLRSEDRHRRDGRDRPHVAAQHDPVRLQPARALRARVRRRRQRPPPPDHVAPRAVRLGRALLRRAGRALRRRLPDVAGAGAGAGAAGGGAHEEYAEQVVGAAARRGLPGRCGRGRRPARQAHPHGQDGEDPVRARRRRRRRRRHHARRQPARRRGRARRRARRVRRRLHAEIAEQLANV